MKKIVIILSVILLASGFLFTSCQKSKESEKKETQVQKEEGKQRPLESKKLTPPQQKQPTVPLEQKEEQDKKIKKEKPLTTEKKNISEKRYLHLEKEFAEGVAYTGDEAEYINDLCTGMGRFWETGDQSKYFELIIKILKKDKIPAVRACAASSLRRKEIDAVESNRENIISALKNSLRDEAAQINAAGALMTWGEYDTALPVLDKGAKEGNTWALAYLFKGYELFDPRGKDILIKALDYPSDEVKMVAADELVKRGWERDISEKKALEVLGRISELKKLDLSENRTLDFALFVLKENKSKNKKAIEILEKIIVRPDMRSDVSYHEREIKETLEYLKEGAKQ